MYFSIFLLSLLQHFCVTYTFVLSNIPAYQHLTPFYDTPTLGLHVVKALKYQCCLQSTCFHLLFLSIVRAPNKHIYLYFIAVYIYLCALSMFIKCHIRSHHCFNSFNVTVTSSRKIQCHHHPSLCVDHKVS